MRAGWGCTLVSDDGVIIASARGNVPSCFPQTSQSGEYLAIVAATRFLTGASRIFSDCANVVKD